MPKYSAKSRLVLRNKLKTRIIQKTQILQHTTTQPRNKHHRCQKKKTPHATNTVDVRKNPHIQKYTLDYAKPITVLNQRALECAKSMIALNQRVCCTCLGTHTVLKTKKNLRYSTVCRACSQL